MRFVPDAEMDDGLAAEYTRSTRSMILWMEHPDDSLPLKSDDGKLFAG